MAFENEEEEVTDISPVPQSLIKTNHPLDNHHITQCEASTMSIFPPINHENLRPDPPQSLPHQDFEVLPASPSPEYVLSGDRLSSWWDFGYDYIMCKVSCIVLRASDHLYSNRGGFHVAAVAMGVALWYWRLRKKRRMRMIEWEASRDQLIRVIKEKDERINTLLRQVAQMNEILLGLYSIKGRPTT